MSASTASKWREHSGRDLEKQQDSDVTAEMLDWGQVGDLHLISLSPWRAWQCKQLWSTMVCEPPGKADLCSAELYRIKPLTAGAVWGFSATWRLKKRDCGGGLTARMRSVLLLLSQLLHIWPHSLDSFRAEEVISEMTEASGGCWWCSQVFLHAQRCKQRWTGLLISRCRLIGVESMGACIRMMMTLAVFSYDSLSQHPIPPPLHHLLMLLVSLFFIVV